MMKWLRKKLGVTDLEAQLRLKDEEAALFKLQADAELERLREEHEAALAEAQAAHAAEVAELADPEPVPPRIEVLSHGFNPDGTVSLQLDWNDEFIKQLRDYGYEGGSEDDVVNLWLSTILVNRPDRIPNGLDRLNHERGLTGMDTSDPEDIPPDI